MTRLLALILCLLPISAHAQDYVIDNAAGAVVRAEINTNLADIAVNSAGTTDPCTLISFGCGGKMWLDTNPATPVFRFRNVADTGWADLFTIDGSAVEWQGGIATSAADIDGGTIDATVIGGTTPAAGTFTAATAESLILERDKPVIRLIDTIGSTAGVEQTFIERGNDEFVIGTSSDATAFVSTDYAMTIGASGATEHSFRIEGTEELSVTATGINVPSGSVTSPIGNFGQISNAGTGSGDIGASLNRFSTIYLVNSPNVSSDVRLKSDIGPVLPAECRAAARFEPKRYRRDGTIHFGYIAQEIEAAFVAESLDPDDYALVQTGEDGFRSVVYAEVEALKTACQ